LLIVPHEILAQSYAPPLLAMINIYVFIRQTAATTTNNMKAKQMQMTGELIIIFIHQ